MSDNTKPAIGLTPPGNQTPTPSRPGAAIRVTTTLMSAVLLGVLVSACGQGPVAAQPAASGCPKLVTGRLDLGAPAKRHDTYLSDLSGSVGATTATLSPQIEAIVTDAVNGGASLAVSIVGRSASDATTILTCPALVPLVNDQDARAQATKNLIAATTSAVLKAFAATSDARAGSDIYGSLIAESGNLKSGAPNRIVITSDGMQVGTTSLPLTLPGVTVELYGVGRLAAAGLNSAAETTVRSTWMRLLTAAGATPIVRFTPYTAGQVTS